MSYPGMVAQVSILIAVTLFFSPLVAPSLSLLSVCCRYGLPCGSLLFMLQIVCCFVWLCYVCVCVCAVDSDIAWSKSWETLLLVGGI